MGQLTSDSSGRGLALLGSAAESGRAKRRSSGTPNKPLHRPAASVPRPPQVNGSVRRIGGTRA
jgi:hypothetical protein